MFLQVDQQARAGKRLYAKCTHRTASIMYAGEEAGVGAGVGAGVEAGGNAGVKAGGNAGVKVGCR